MVKKIFFMAVLLLATLCQIKAESNLTLSDATTEAGGTITMYVASSGPLDAFSFVVKTPEGINLSKVQRGALIKVYNDDDEYIYTFSNSTREDGTRYVLCYSTNAVPTTESGEVAKLVFNIDPEIASGKYDIKLQETECALGGAVVSTYTDYTATLTVGHVHTPNADGVCTSCLESVKLVINDNESADFIPDYKTYAEVTYNRVLAVGKYATIVLPFAPDESSLESYSFFKLKEVDGNLLVFGEETLPQAGVPYLYRLKSGVVEATPITGTKVSVSTTLNSVSASGLTMIGSYTNQIVDCKSNDAINYYGFSSAENEINRATSSLTIKPYRAYFTSSTANSAKQMRIVISNETTGIEETVELEDVDSDANLYNLMGRKVQNSAKGVYILNGKKVIIK